MFAVALEGLRKTYLIRDWWKEFIDQCWFIAKVTSLPVIFISIPFGAVIALHVGSFNSQLGAESATGSAMVLAIVREAAPVATALMIAGAGGSAMTADLGSRKIRDEIAAMEVMAINPMHRLVTPRLWAASFVSIFLVSLVSLAGLAGGFVYNVFVQGVTPGAYFSGFTVLVQSPTCCRPSPRRSCSAWSRRWWLATRASTPRVVQRAWVTPVNQAVVVTFILIFFVNFVMTTLYFALVPQKF